MPSAEVLDGIAGALALTAAEREHLFLLAQHRPPQAHYEAPEGITPQLQRVLDSLEFSPAYVKTAAWDIVAWNRAAAAVLTDYSAIAPHERNILRMMFRDSGNKVGLEEWNIHARFAVAAFRVDVARAGASESIAALVDELSQSSPEFEAIWREQDVGSYGEGVKHFHRLETGPLTLEYSSFVVDGRPDLGMVIFTPATAEDAERVKLLVCGAVSLG